MPPRSPARTRLPAAVAVVAALMALAALAGCGTTEETAGPIRTTTSTTEDPTTSGSTTTSRPTTSSTSTSSTTTRPIPTVSTPTTGGTPDPDDRAFCSAAAQLADLDDELGDAIDEGQVDQFKDGYRRYIALMEDAEAVAPDEIADELSTMVGVLHDLQPTVDAARSADDLSAIGDDPQVKASSEAFDTVQSYTEDHCPDID